MLVNYQELLIIFVEFCIIPLGKKVSLGILVEVRFDCGMTDCILYLLHGRAYWKVMWRALLPLLGEQSGPGLGDLLMKREEHSVR